MRNRRPASIGTLFLYFITCLVTISGAARAEDPEPAAVERPSTDASQLEHSEYWGKRADLARERVAKARAALDELDAAVSRMQRRNHPRGDERIALRAERDEARAAYEAAVHYLEVELWEEARAAGAQRHWLAERR